MGYRILVIEDNANNLHLMTYLLKASGHLTPVARDGVEGLASVRREVPDLILCDIQMPRMDGYELAAILRGDPALAAIPRIAVTALAMMGDRDRILAAGFHGYLSKPIMPRTFVAQVEAFLSHVRPQSSPPAAPDLVDRQSKPETKGRGKTILVVDDSKVNLLLARSLLEPSGYELVEASGGYEALAAARRTRPTMVLCDVHMRQGDGFECIARFKADPLLSRIPFLFISAAILGAEVRRRCLDLGCVRFIERPVSPQALLEIIETVLAEGHNAPRTALCLYTPVA